MMLGRAALAHLRNSFQQHGSGGGVSLRQIETSKSSEQLTSTTTKTRATSNCDIVDIDDDTEQSMSTSSSSGVVGGQRRSARQKSVSTKKQRRTSRTVSPSLSRRSSSVSTSRRFSTSSAVVVDTDDDGVVLVKDGSKRHYFDPESTLIKFDGNSTSSKFDLLHAVRYKVSISTNILFCVAYMYLQFGFCIFLARGKLAQVNFWPARGYLDLA